MAPGLPCHRHQTQAHMDLRTDPSPPISHCPLKGKSAPWNLTVLYSSNTLLHLEFHPGAQLLSSDTASSRFPLSRSSTFLCPPSSQPLCQPRSSLLLHSPNILEVHAFLSSSFPGSHYLTSGSKQPILRNVHCMPAMSQPPLAHSR